MRINTLKSASESLTSLNIEHSFKGRSLIVIPFPGVDSNETSLLIGRIFGSWVLNESRDNHLVQELLELSSSLAEIVAAARDAVTASRTH